MTAQERNDPPLRAATARPEVTAQLMARTGLDEAMLDRLVRRFYARVREDALLGPVFDEAIRDWEPHLEKMVDFWSSVALMTGRYHGRPMQKHLPLPIVAAHFDRWLALFRDTAREVCPPQGAAHLVASAERIAFTMQANREYHRQARGEAAPPARS
jgi:hemoglobin